MEIVEIPIALIDEDDRVRPVSKGVAEQLAWDIEARGLRQPVEVSAKKGGRWRLVSGGHRLVAHRILGRETISAVVVTGKALELRRDELLENLARNELSKLERAQFLAEMKRVYQALHPEAKHGGDRKGAEFKGENQDANLASWYRDVAIRGDWAERTVMRAAQIGERIAPAAALLLRGTAIEDNQSELEALARVEPEAQPDVVRLVVRPENPLPTIRAAVAFTAGRTEQADPEKKHLAALQDHWNRASARTRRQFIAWLRENGEEL
jgi:ParB family chromosome partitioning protein